MKPFLVFLLCVFSICCFRAIEPVQVVTPEEPPEPEQFCSPIEGPTEIRTDGHVSLENVSFSYVPNWIEKVEYSVIPECVLIRNDYKPDPIGGRTLQFNLHYSASEEEATILIFKIADYKNVFGPRTPSISGVGLVNDRVQVTFTVADRDDSATAAERLGATVLSSADTEWTREAVVRDPQGATLTLSQFAPPDW